MADKDSIGTLVNLARAGLLDAVKRILEETNYDVDSVDIFGSTALHGASRGGRAEIVRYLISRGANVNITHPCDPDIRRVPSTWTGSEPPLFHAVSGGHVEVAELLIRSGAKTDVVVEGQNLLDRAISSNNPEMIRLVISHGFDINRTNDRGRKPLATAMILNADESVRFLLENGADYNTSYGSHPISVALGVGRKPNSYVELLLKHIKEKEGEKGVVDYLNSNDNSRGFTALHSASSLGHYDGVKLFLECGADPNIRDKEGKKPQDHLQSRYFSISEDTAKKILALLESRNRPSPHSDSPNKRMRE